MSFTAAFYGFWDTWAPYDPANGFYGEHNCVFDGINKLIFINPEISEISVKEDIYSNWKEWIRIRDHAKYDQAIRTTGGDPINQELTTGDVYFLINGWRLVVSHSVTIDGVIYSDDYDTPFLRQPGTNIVINKVSHLVQSVAPDNTIQQSLNYGGQVVVDFTELDSGTAYPYGTWGQPVNTFEHAKEIALRYGINEILIRNGNGAVTGDMSNYQISSVNNRNSVVLAPSANLDGTTFKNLTIEGYCSGNTVQMSNCKVYDLYDFVGSLENCSIHGTIQPANLGTFYMFGCRSGIPGEQFSTPIIDCTKAFSGLSVAIRSYTGSLTWRNITTSNFTGSFELDSGKIYIESNCTAGYLSVRGVATLSDLSNGLIVDQTALVYNLFDVELSTGFGNLVNQVSRIDSLIGGVNSNIVNVNNTLSGVDDNLGNVIGEINNTTINTNSIVSTLGSSMNNVITVVGGVENSIANISTSITNIGGAISNINVNINSGTLSNIESSINAVNDTVSTTIVSSTQSIANIVYDTHANVLTLANTTSVIEAKVDNITTELGNLDIVVNGALTPSQAMMLLEMYELLGLDPTKPLVVTEHQRYVQNGTIEQNIDTNADRTIVTRVE